MNRGETMVLGSRIGTAGRIAPGQARGVASVGLPPSGPPLGDDDAGSGVTRAPKHGRPAGIACEGVQDHAGGRTEWCAHERMDDR